MRLAKTLVLAGTLTLAGLALAAAREGSAEQGQAWDGEDLVTLEGTVTKVQRPSATFQADGKSYTIHLGPTWYWEREGYSLASGDKVTVTGEVSREGRALHLYPYQMVKGGETYLLADPDGVPAWSRGWRGAGRGGMGHGYGWRQSWRQGCRGDCPNCPDCGASCPRCPSCGGCPRGCGR
jgi:hypothetical protein